MARKRILLIDDYGPFATSLSLALSAEHDVEVTLTGEEALARLDGLRYDAVLCDVVMPDVSGVDVYRRVRQSSPALARRFVFLTAGAVSPAAQAFLDQSDNLVLRKPFQLQALSDTLARLWADEAASRGAA